MAPDEAFPKVTTAGALSDDTLVGLAQPARRAAVGSLAGPAIHEINNWLFGILAQTELLLMEPALDPATEERLRAIADSGASLKQTLRRLGAAVRGEEPPEPVPLEETVRSVLALPGFADASVSAPPATLTPAGTPATVADIVFHALVALVGRAPEVALRREDGAAVLEARATQPSRSSRPPVSPELGIAVAGALARELGGSLEHSGDHALRLSLPLAS